MGCDGGTIPTRDELVRLKKKPEQKDKDSERAFKWKHCAITQEPLRGPIVGCELGSLYNKESVIELILDRSKYPGSARFDHIRALKDVKSLQLTNNQAYRDPEGDKGGVYIDRNTAQYICPITGLEMSGKYRFCFLLDCGCVFAERAIKEIKSETCNKCGKPYDPKNVIILNGSEEEVDGLRGKMEERRKRAKLEKKSKRKAKEESVAGAASSDAGTGDKAEDGPTSSKVAKQDPAAAAATTDKDKKTTVGKLVNDTKSKLSASVSGASASINGKDARKIKSIQDDPRASAAFKSLFTSSDKAKSQPKAHWVTYNPQYN